MLLFALFAVMLSTKMNKNGNLCEKSCALTSIWAINCLAGIVISVKIWGLIFLPYIADIKSVDNAKGKQTQKPLNYLNLR